MGIIEDTEIDSLKGWQTWSKYLSKPDFTVLILKALGFQLPSEIAKENKKWVG